MIIYRGPSLIDGTEIVAIVKPSKSKNVKTGGMVQTYILLANVNPLEASKTGADVSICGTCPHRGIPSTDPARKQAEKRSCYVNLGQGPLGIYKAFARGRYAVADHAATVKLGAGKMVRLGTYGDPAAVPSHVWEALTSEAAGWTGYTHQSGMTGADVRSDMVMISADTLEGAQAAWAKGERTFRVIKDVSEIVKGVEISCPASKEAGARTTCEACGLCGGTSVKAKSIAIVDHGPQNRKGRLVVNRVASIAPAQSATA